MEEETPKDRGYLQEEWHIAKRQMGCLWGCLTEPLTLVILAVASLIGGYFWGRRGRLAETKEGDDSHDAGA